MNNQASNKKFLMLIPPTKTIKSNNPIWITNPKSKKFTRSETKDQNLLSLTKKK